MDNAGNNNKLYTYLSVNLLLPPYICLWCSGYIINLIIKALIYRKGISKLERNLISVSNKAKFDFIRERGFISKLYNIIKYIMRSISCYKDFAKY